MGIILTSQVPMWELQVTNVGSSLISGDIANKYAVTAKSSSWIAIPKGMPYPALHTIELKISDIIKDKQQKF